MIRNHYLFSSQFRNYLQGQQLEDEEFFEGFKETVISFLDNAEQEHLNSPIQQVVALLLAQLQFANASLEQSDSGPPAQYGYLYDGFPLENKVSCVYVVPNSPPGRGQRWVDSPREVGQEGQEGVNSLLEGGQESINSPLEGGKGGVLDAAQKGNFPAFELVHLLQQENLEWGILTNGLVWRLYSTLSPQPYEQYLEIDFSETQEEEFKVFWQLFSLTLFLPNENDVTPLETYIEESAKEAEVIEKHIKSNIEEILENICFGLLSFAGKDKQPLNEKEKQTYFENAVYLLFRLLFVFYAESRELLPINNPEYRTNSLQALLKQAHDWMQSGVTNPDDTELWDGFRDLCHKIEFGDQSLGIPEYDGGLFDSQLHEFLSDAGNKVKNLYFVKVLYLLGYRTQRKQEQAIDYRDLSVRSLGSLYEGILEYKLFIAEEDLVLRKKTIIPLREAGKVKKSERVIQEGHVYFSQAANERHDTGSYYTPEYVVEYMVKNSVRVGLEERWNAFSPTIERYARELRVAVSEDMRIALLKKLDQELLRFVEEQILSFKVLDPAMGSGHFLVNALNTIIHFILKVLQVKVSPVISPAISPAINDRSKGVSRLKPASSELSGHQGASASLGFQPGVLTPGASECSDHQGASASLRSESGILTPDFSHHNPTIDLTPAVWRRKVVERCIFGVDINPLATELAKLSLWIASADTGKPLTFLNHHLKCGNSLIGAQLREIGRYPLTNKTQKDDGQLGFLEKDEGFRTTVQNALACLEQITSHESGDIENIGSKKTWLKEAERALQPYKSLCDAHTSLFFCSEMSHDDYDRMLLAFTPDFTWDGELFFHWELEFPEVMLKERGFNVLLGNPPYGAKLQINEKKFITQNYDCFEGNFDIYTAFMELGFTKTSSNGYWSYILPVSWQGGSNYSKVREYLKDNGVFRIGLKLPYNTFPDAYIGTGIYVVKKGVLSKYNSMVYEFPVRYNVNKGFIDKLNFM